MARASELVVQSQLPTYARARFRKTNVLARRVAATHPPAFCERAAALSRPNRWRATT